MLRIRNALVPKNEKNVYTVHKACIPDLVKIGSSILDVFLFAHVHTQVITMTGIIDRQAFLDQRIQFLLQPGSPCFVIHKFMHFLRNFPRQMFIHYKGAYQNQNNRPTHAIKLYSKVCKVKNTNKFKINVFMPTDYIFD